MRLTLRFAAVFAVLVLTVAGCGGADVAYREVPGDPVELDVPGNDLGAAPTPAATEEAEAEETPEAEADAEATAEPQATAAPDTGADDGTGGAAEAPAAQEPDDTAPAQETPAPGLEDYCAANPGAC